MYFFRQTGSEVKQGIKIMREKLYRIPRRFQCKDNLDTYGFDAVTNMAFGYHHVLHNSRCSYFTEWCRLYFAELTIMSYITADFQIL